MWRSLSGGMPLRRWVRIQRSASASFTKKKKNFQTRHRALSVPCAPDTDSVGLVTWSQSAAALPAPRARRLPAGLPQGQIVLVVCSHPCRTRHGSHIQAQRQKDAHQSDQLQRCQRGAARRLFRLGDSGHHGGGGSVESRSVSSLLRGAWQWCEGRVIVVVADRVETLRLWAAPPPRIGGLRRLQRWRKGSKGSAGATGS